jgi:hypothetical protein
MNAGSERSSSSGVLVAAAAVGVGLWFMSSIAAGRQEAWDSGLYWMLFYPLSLVACWVFGLRNPDRPWRWALAIFFGQCLALGLRAGELGNLFPLGLVMFGVLALPGVAVAKLGAKRNTAS